VTAPVTTGAVPAIDGWFTTGDRPALLGTRCQRCGTVAFPPSGGRSGDEVATTQGGRAGSGGGYCPNPGCDGDGDDLGTVELSRQGRVWSYTDARYQPPPPYVPRTDPYEPFALAAVELEAEGIVVLGQVADGYGCDDLTIGAPVELVVEPLYEDAGTTYLTWRWRPTPATEGAGR
jgi:uncharacterized protein